MKDRIIEKDEFIAKFEIKLPGNMKKTISVFWRYVEAIKLMITEEETIFDYEITQWNENTIEIRIWRR